VDVRAGLRGTKEKTTPIRGSTAGSTFELAQRVFDDPHHVVLENYFMADEKEQRAQAIGHEPKSASAFGDFSWTAQTAANP
jgi:uncharacterized DUF497 family protein